jgi:predicted nucleic acid-binding protein
VILVDSNVLIDVVTEDATWVDWSASQVARAIDTAGIAINPIIYGEFSIPYLFERDAEQALAVFSAARLDIPWPAAFLAGKAFTLYRSRGGLRTAPFPDFLIGAHAAVSGLTLLTRDATRYREYFPKIKLIAPE